MRCWWSLYISGVPPSHRPIQLVHSVCVVFWQAVRHLWSLQVSRIPCHTDLYPGSNMYLTRWFIRSVLFLTGSGISVVPTCVCNNPSHGRPPWSELLPYQLVHFVCVVFDRRIDCCGPYMFLRSPGTQTSTNVGMSTWPADSFCLYCFWQMVRCLLWLHVSGIPHHTDIHPSRNIYPTSWFILSVLIFVTGSEKFVVPTHVQDPIAHGPPPW